MSDVVIDRFLEQLKDEVAALRTRNEQLAVEVMERSAEASEAREEVRRLREAIVTHRDQTGHNMCWLNDHKLWAVLGDDKSPTLAEMRMPPEGEFLTGCRAYYASRFRGQEATAKPS